MIVEVVFLPPIATDLPSKVCVVIDVLRATSTLVSMFEADAERVTLADSISGALAQADAEEKRPLVCGESGGVRPDGFDHGNSPREFSPGSLSGRGLVMCTSNGTGAMRLVADAPVVLAGSLFNASAVARTAVREAVVRGLDIALVCSGDILGTKFAIDDAFCAGHLVTLIECEAASVFADQGGPDGEAPISPEESAIAAVRLYRSYLLEAGVLDAAAPPPTRAILRAFWESHNAQVLRRVGLAADVEHCAQLDISARVPRLRVEDGRLVLTGGE